MPVDKQAILDAFYFRFAAKEFDPTRKISDDDFQFILETARLSPSSFGFEPWNLIVLQDMKLREKLREFTWGAQGTLPTASHFILITAKTKQALAPEGEYITHILRDVRKFDDEMLANYRRTYKKFIESDFQLLDTERALWDWAGKSAYIPLANMMTAAAMIGIDSCPVEGFEADKLEPLLKAENIIDGEENRLVAMVAFGYRKAPPKRPKTRRSMGEMVRWVT